MEVSGQLYGPAALLPGKLLPLLNVREAGSPSLSHKVSLNDLKCPILTLVLWVLADSRDR